MRSGRSIQWVVCRWSVPQPSVLAMLVLALLAASVASLVRPGLARAEYRAYELEVVDRYECRLKQQKPCETARLVTAMDPDLYARTHGGEARVGVLLLSTWMCYGDTSDFRPVCPRPVARKGRFSVGDEVVVTLAKHITHGWRGKVEVAYYQASVHSNVYGVRFADRRGVYARYFEKDLQKAGEAASGGTVPPATASSGSAGPAAAPPQ